MTDSKREFRTVPMKDGIRYDARGEPLPAAPPASGPEPGRFRFGLDDPTPPASGDVEAAWEALKLATAGYISTDYVHEDIDRLRPLIEAAIRAESGLDALREVAEAARVYLIRRSEHNADELSAALARLTEAER